MDCSVISFYNFFGNIYNVPVFFVITDGAVAFLLERGED
jgi:hypothetical protein